MAWLDSRPCIVSPCVIVVGLCVHMCLSVQGFSTYSYIAVMIMKPRH